MNIIESQKRLSQSPLEIRWDTVIEKGRSKVFMKEVRTASLSDVVHYSILMALFTQHGVGIIFKFYEKSNLARTI